MATPLSSPRLCHTNGKTLKPSARSRPMNVSRITTPRTQPTHRVQEWASTRENAAFQQVGGGRIELPTSSV